MSASDTCPYCGDGPEAIGTLNHIECVEALAAQIDQIQQRIAELEAGLQAARNAAFSEGLGRMEAEDTLAAERAKRCATCRKRDDTLLCPVWDHRDSDWCHKTPDGFGCHKWEARP